MVVWCLTRHQSSLKTNQISIVPYFLEIKGRKVVADERQKAQILTEYTL